MSSQLMMTLAQGHRADLQRAAEQARLAKPAVAARHRNHAPWAGLRLVGLASRQRRHLANALSGGGGSAAPSPGV